MAGVDQEDMMRSNVEATKRKKQQERQYHEFLHAYLFALISSCAAP